MNRALTCIVCPKGCPLVVEIEDGKVVSVTGNTCKRGEAYAEAECLHPERTITTTVKTKDGEVIPVKTDKPIPKEKMVEIMATINRTVVDLPISVGDVIIKDIYGANVVATCNKSL